METKLFNLLIPSYLARHTRRGPDEPNQLVCCGHARSAMRVCANLRPSASINIDPIVVGALPQEWGYSATRIRNLRQREESRCL
jgi:hypothetical protein